MFSCIVRWYRTRGRHLPWRKRCDAYHIFISELMLQQTHVERVLPKYRIWLKRFPDWSSLAHASTRDLIEAWSGLGYNRRLLYAREAARHIILHGVPQTEQAWRALRGIGPYMAAALSEFVNHVRAVVIDTNIRRVIGRAFLGKPFPRTTHDKRIRRVLEKLTVHRGAHWELPHALMDIGATICFPRAPHCEICPLKKICKARHRFLSDAIHRTLRLKRSPRVTERRHANKKYPDRIYRGRILAAITCKRRVHVAKLGPAIDQTYRAARDAAWIKTLVQRLEADGLVTLHANGIVTLPAF